MQFKEKLLASSIERIERSIGQDFEEALKEKPKELLVSILQDIRITSFIIIKWETRNGKTATV
jgi:hypothetical protein